MSQTQETLTLDRLLDPVTRCLTPEVAQRLVELRADADLQARVDLLADKNTEGQLTPEERDEYELYVRASRFIAILQAKAQKRLEEHFDLQSEWVVGLTPVGRATGRVLAMNADEQRELRAELL